MGEMLWEAGWWFPDKPSEPACDPVTPPLGAFPKAESRSHVPKADTEVTKGTAGGVGGHSGSSRQWDAVQEY